MSKLTDQIKITPLLDTLRLQKISDEVYFSEKYSDYVSNSRLGFINPKQDGTPQKFLDGFKGNRIFSDSLTLGSVVHEQILQPELYDICPDLDRPTAKVGFVADETYRIAKDKEDPQMEEILEACRIVDYYKGNPSQEKYNELYHKVKHYMHNLHSFMEKGENKVSTYLDSKNIIKARGCIEALQKNKKVQELLHPKGLVEDPISECEQAILLDVEVECPNLPKFIVRLKAKLDNYTIDKETGIITVNDVKTIGRTINYCDEQILKYHYQRELSMYSYLLTQCAKKFYNIEHPRVRGNFLWVSTIPSETGHYSKVTPMTASLFKDGMDEFKELLRMAAITLYYKDAVKAEEYFDTL